MSTGEEQGAEIVIPVSEGRPTDFDFHPTADQRLDESVSQYATQLRKTAIIIAINDDCDEVQVKHVKQAVKHACRLTTENTSLIDNHQIWWLVAAILFAIALAVPDIGAMFFGDTQDHPTCWFCLKVAFIALSVCGVLVAIVGCYVALGPHQPAWVIAIQKLVDKLHYWSRN